MSTARNIDTDEDRHLKYLLQPIKPRLSWEEYKEKHKSKFEDRLGGVQKQQADYRRLLDEERRQKVACLQTINRFPIKHSMP